MPLSVSQWVRLKVYLSVNITDPATGIVFIYEMGPRYTAGVPTYLDPSNFSVPSLSISVALNVLLTLMIVARIVLPNRDIRNITKSPIKVGALYKAIVTSLVESCAVYSVICLIYILSWTKDLFCSGASLSVLVQTQVRVVHLSLTNHNPEKSSSHYDEEQTIAPFLITLRIANRSAWTRETDTDGGASVVHYGSQGVSAGGDGTVLDQRSMEAGEETRFEPGFGIETVDLRHDD